MKAIDTTFLALLEHLHRGGQFGYWWAYDRYRDIKRTYWWPVDRPTPLPDIAGADLYYSVNALACIPTTNAAGDPAVAEHVRGRREHIATISCLFADLDAKDFASTRDLYRHLFDLPLEPSAIVASGSGGLHCYWLLHDAFTIDSDDHRDAIAYIQRAWAAAMGADPAACNLSQSLRVPGTQNYKCSPIQPVSLWRCELNRTFALADLTIWLPPPPTPRTTQPGPSANSFDKRPITKFNASTPIGQLLERYGYQWAGRRYMISPYSGSKRPGVLVDEVENKCFVFTAGDPLFDSHRRSPFDVVLTLDFAGDRERALDAIKAVL